MPSYYFKLINNSIEITALLPRPADRSVAPSRPSQEGGEEVRDIPHASGSPGRPGEPVSGRNAGLVGAFGHHLQKKAQFDKKKKKQKNRGS